MFFSKKKKETQPPAGDTRFWWLKGNCIACCGEIGNSNPPIYTLRLGRERIELCERCAKLLRDKLICEFGSD